MGCHCLLQREAQICSISSRYSILCHILFLKYLVLVFPAGRNRNAVSESYLIIFIAGRYGKGAACQLCPFWVCAKYLLRAIPRGLDRGGSCCHHQGGFSPLWIFIYGCRAASEQGSASYTEFQVPVWCFGPGLPSSAVHSPCALLIKDPLNSMGNNFEGGWWLDRLKDQVPDLAIMQITFSLCLYFFPFSSIRWSWTSQCCMLSSSLKP